MKKFSIKEIKYTNVIATVSNSVLRIRDVYPGSRILIFPIPDPGSRISDPKNSNKREGWKKFCYQTFFCSHKFHKIEFYFVFEMRKKQIWAKFQRIIEVLSLKKLSLSSQKYGLGIRDPRSGKNLFRIPYPGVKAPDPGSGSATLVKLCDSIILRF